MSINEIRDRTTHFRRIGVDKKLDGGRDGIYKDKNTVLRPASEWTEHVHDFLRFLNDSGFDKVPIPYEINGDGREKVSYVEGDVHNEALPEQAKSDAALVSFCRLIREYHDLGAKYINQLSGNETWMLPTGIRRSKRTLKMVMPCSI